MARADRTTWAKRVERWKDSGLSAREFGAEIGVSANALSWWKWELGRKKGQAQPAKRRARRKKTAVSPMTFVEMAAPVRSELLEVVFPSGIRLRVPGAFDAGMLARVVEVLEKRR
jgi:hypothetical protein